MSLRFLASRVTKSLPLNRFYARHKPPVEGPSGPSNHPDGGHKFFRNVALFAALPIIVIVMAKCYSEGKFGAAEPDRPPFVPYEYLRRRTKRFPWGDGTKSLFHNDRTNPLPDGYVDGYNDDECDDE